MAMMFTPLLNSKPWKANLNAALTMPLGWGGQIQPLRMVVRRALPAIALVGGLLLQLSGPALAQSVQPYNPSTSTFGGFNFEVEPYRLGPGDSIQIDIFDIPEFSGANGQYTVLVDGTLNLPWIGKVNVWGLNLDQASATISRAYAGYINDPLITVSLLAPRPLRFGIVGQINRPGVYTIETDSSDSQRYTVTQAIQAAGGITQVANVRSIEVRRPQPNGTEERITVDLWAFLQGGELDQDIVLRDGDTINIPQAQTLTALEASQLASTSFSPEGIIVNVVGEVVSPGQQDVLPNATLNQAILAAGGFDTRRARRGSVELVRLNPDGTVSNRTIPVDFADGIDEETNPPLRNNDIIIVGRSGIASASDFLDTLLTPVTSVFSILRLFGAP
jgi:polysaccharide export outer membrane protein